MGMKKSKTRSCVRKKYIFRILVIIDDLLVTCDEIIEQKNLAKKSNL